MIAMSSAILQTIGISKIFGEGPNRVVALDGATLALDSGQVLLIMGPSGSPTSRLQIWIPRPAAKCSPCSVTWRKGQARRLRSSVTIPRRKNSPIA